MMLFAIEVNIEKQLPLFGKRIDFLVAIKSSKFILKSVLFSHVFQKRFCRIQHEMPLRRHWFCLRRIGPKIECSKKQCFFKRLVSFQSKRKAGHHFCYGLKGCYL